MFICRLYDIHMISEIRKSRICLGSYSHIKIGKNIQRQKIRYLGIVIKNEKKIFEKKLLFFYFINTYLNL